MYSGLKKYCEKDASCCANEPSAINIPANVVMILFFMILFYKNYWCYFIDWGLSFDKYPSALFGIVIADYIVISTIRQVCSVHILSIPFYSCVVIVCRIPYFTTPPIDN